MSDILDVLNIKSFPQKRGKSAEKDSKTTQQSQQSLAEQRQIYAPEEYASEHKKRKLSAMNRELYSLIGSNVPPIAIDTGSATTGGVKRFKDKLKNAHSKKDEPWRKLAFTNPARNDGLILHHWSKAKPVKKSDLIPETQRDQEQEQAQEVEATISNSDVVMSNTEEKEHVEESGKIDEEKTGIEEKKSKESISEEELYDSNEYRFAKYNTSLNIPSFTEEEYSDAMKVIDQKRKAEEEAKAAQLNSIRAANTVKEEAEKKAKKEIEIKKEKNDDQTKQEEGSEGTNDKEEEKPQTTDATSNEVPNQDHTATATATATEDDKDAVPKEVEEDQTKESSDKTADDGTKKDEANEDDAKNTKDRPWSYEETQFLFALCNSFDMRWSVIYDRYQDKYNDRSLEDLKSQMYSISAFVLEKRANPNDAALIKALKSFNKDKEQLRKHYLSRLIHRAPTEIAEEESLVIEARKFELAAKKMLSERAQLLQLLDSPQSSASVQQYLTSQGLTQLYNSLMSSDKNKKRKVEIPVAPLLGPNAIPHTQHIQMSQHQASGNAQVSGSGSTSNTQKSDRRRPDSGRASASASASVGASSVPKTVSKLTEVQMLLQKKLTPEELEVYGIEIHTERIQPGVHVRSQKIASFKPSVQAKVHEILGQHGFSIKPTVPTGPVCKKFDELLYKIANLVDLKKQTDKLTAEIELIKRQKGII